jgi:hypothetical protein
MIIYYLPEVTMASRQNDIILFSFILSIVLSVTASGWTESERARGGIRIGGVYTRFTEDVHPHYMDGLLFGFGLTQPLHPNMALQPEIMYSRKLSDVLVYYNGSPTNGSLKTSHIVLNMLLKARTKNELSLRPSIYAGPSVSLLLGQTMKVRTSRGTYTEDVVSGYVSAEKAVLIGAGLDFPVTFCVLSLDLRYTQGLNSIVVNSGIKSQTFSFLLGISF